MKLEKKVKKKLEDLGIFLLSGFLIGIATYNFASAFSFPMVGFTGIGLIGYHLFGIPIGMTVVCLNSRPSIFHEIRAIGIFKQTTVIPIGIPNK